MKIAGMFAGVGGLELGLKKAGHEPVMLCELDLHAQAVLRRRFPNVTIHHDVLDLESLPRSADILAAGFPCQDLSQAGRTTGMRGSRSRLVKRVFELLERRRVPWVVLENVPNMLRLHKGSAMRYIIDELERLGYDWAYRVVDTRAFGLPQRRLRVFVLASRVADPAPLLLGQSEEPRIDDEDRAFRGGVGDGYYDESVSAYGFYWTEGNKGVGWTRHALPTLKAGSSLGIPGPPAAWFPHRPVAFAFVVPSVEDGEELQGFDRGWTHVSNDRQAHRARWRMVGNAVSVPVAEWLGQCLAAEPTAWQPGDQLTATAAMPQAAHGYKDGRRFTSDASIWPVRVRRRPLASVLRDDVPLSYRAADGFLKRLKRSGLRVAPDQFRSALDKYVNFARSATAA
jgi:DNA (cytosine-5)-methyltransferase 1